MLSRNYPLLRYCVSLALLLLPLFLCAQEICDNGIDDDADGLVDLNDTVDCACNLAPQTPSLLPNPSLENFDPDQPGCKSIQPGGLPDGTNQANCLENWQRASLGTTDAWNAFTLAGSAPDYPSELPLPLPSGSGVAGFWVGVQDTDGVQFANGDGTHVRNYREYLATCFEEGNELIAGEDYRLTFSLGFTTPQTYDNKGKLVDIDSPSGVELSIYGIRECGQLNFGLYQGCPEEAGAAGYELLSNVTVEGKGGAWTETTVEFTALNDYAAFAIGGSCGADIKRENSKYYRNYYFIDDLILNRTSLFRAPAVGPITVDGENICDEEIVLTGKHSPEARYQWYRNGVAITGAESNILTLNDATGREGSYRLRASYAEGCATSDAVLIQRPVIPDQFPDSLAICSEGSKSRISAGKMPDAQYLWSDGSTESSFTISEPGIYSVTVTANCFERVESIHAVLNSDFSYRYRLSPERPCVGDTVSITVETDWYTDGVMYIPSSGGFYYQDTDEPLRVVAGETASVSAMLFTACGMASDEIRIPALEPFVAEAAITDLNCHGPEGMISLEVTEGTPTEFRWADEVRKSVEIYTSELQVKQPGTYAVTISGEDRCTTSFEYEVADRGFNATALATDVSCGNDGSITVVPGGGASPYRTEWFTATDNPPLASQGSTLAGVPQGNYLARISDAEGCVTEIDVTVGGPEPLRVAVTDTVVGCAPTQTGILNVGVEGGTAPYTYALEGYGAQTEAAFAGLPEGTYRLSVEDALGCRSEMHSVDLAFTDAVTLDLGEDRLVDLGEEVILQAEIAGALAGEGEITWSATSGLIEPDPDFFNLIATVVPKTSGVYTSELRMPDGCVYADTVRIQVQTNTRVFVPTAFSPNGDGVNDVFTAYSNAGAVRIENLKIFDRWGGVVFASEERDIQWDGTRGGTPLDPGAYLYAGTIRLQNGSTRPIRGAVTITR